MKRNDFLTLTILFVCCSIQLKAQECGTYNQRQETIEWNSLKRESITKHKLEDQAHHQRYKLSKAIKADSVIVIPTVVHVLHYDGKYNVSKAKIVEMVNNLSISYKSSS